MSTYDTKYLELVSMAVGIVTFGSVIPGAEIVPAVTCGLVAESSQVLSAAVIFAVKVALLPCASFHVALIKSSATRMVALGTE